MRSLGLASPAALARAPPDSRCLLSPKNCSDWAKPAVPRAATTAACCCYLLSRMNCTDWAKPAVPHATATARRRPPSLNNSCGVRGRPGGWGLPLFCEASCRLLRN